MPKTKKRIGRQEPTFERITPYDYSLGDDAVAFFEGFGVKFTEYQKHELTLYLARNYNDDYEFDEYAGATIGLSRPRQTGKSYAARFYAIWCALIEGKKVLYSAHNTDTTIEMFKAIKTFLENTPALYQHLLPEGGIYNAPLKLGFYFKNGGTIEMKTRTKSASRGRSTEVVIIDEAQELTEAQLEALSPTSIASEEDSQMIAIGTPPGPECVGTVYRDWYDTAHDEDGDVEDLWWLEWAVPSVPPDIFDEDLWYAYNPGMGWRITTKKMRAEATKFKNNPEGFAREYLGYWAPRYQYHAVISQTAWSKCEITEEEAAAIKGSCAYGIKFSPDCSRGSLSVAIRPNDASQPRFVELVDIIDLSHGLGETADWLAERLPKSIGVVIDGQSNAATLVQYLRDRNVSACLITTPGAKEYGAACSAFIDGVRDASIAHAGYAELTESVTQCKRRPIGKMGLFGFDGLTPEVDSTIADSAALAFWLASTSKRKPGRKMRVGY